ncbi:MAG: ISNCY family transposase, partial [Mariprofundaceae bacterium]|nr:ISNCY family transposase [Mariprofundaceae bacterium]
MNRGIKMPGSSTVIDNLNIISENTMEVIKKAQLEQIKNEGLDNFEECVMDSTSSKGNSERPTESNLIARLTARIFH